MPYIEGVAAKVEELSWNSFAEPTHETESWQPDPDSIPVAGGLPDPRFNKDTLTEKHKMALKRDRRLGIAINSPSQSTTTGSSTASPSRTSTPNAVANWPAPSPRATGYPRAFALPKAPPILSPFAATNLVQAASPAPIMAPAHAPATSAGTTSADPLRGTMEMLPVQPPFQRPRTPAASINSQRSNSSTATPTPTWARTIAHLLGESPPKRTPSSQPPPTQIQPAAPSSASKTPHLRRKDLVPKIETSTSVATSPSVSEAVKVPFTPWANGSAMQHLSPTDFEPAETVKDLGVQRALLESFIPQEPDPASSISGHQRYLNTRLVTLMEDEMDMAARTTRRELREMSDKELESHLAKTTSMHKTHLKLKQRASKSDESDLDASLFAFQEKEERQFKQIRA